MRQLRYFLTSLALFVVVSEGHADDEQDVLDAMAVAHSAWINLDYEAIKASLAEDMDLFHTDGNLLEFPDWEGLKQWLDAGPEINIQPFHQNVKIYGKTEFTQPTSA